jgi:membrane protein YdbS with pleckstrin-like domain
VVIKERRAIRARFQKEKLEEMIHLLLVVAVVLFVLWLLFHAAGAMVNLIWIAIAVLVIIWLVGLVRGRSTAS